MPLPDLTRPKSGSKYQMLPFGQFGFGTTKSSTVIVQEWIVRDDAPGEFEPIKIVRKETHKKYGIFENYSWEESDVSKGE